ALYAGTLGTSGVIDSVAFGPVGISASSMRVIPSLQAKLGGTYTYSMAQGDLTLDAGWMWINYFEAISTTGGALFGTLPAAIGGGDVVYPVPPIATNLGLQGVYFGLKWLGNVV